MDFRMKKYSNARFNAIVFLFSTSINKVSPRSTFLYIKKKSFNVTINKCNFHVKHLKIFNLLRTGCHTQLRWSFSIHDVDDII